MTPDPFDTAGVRERVLAAWSVAPVRFREDANAEEDLALGGYRDRVVVELAQNAADAAARAGVAGRLVLTLGEVDGTAALVAANTGCPLDAEGVQSLATLRASAKRLDDSVGRFGVGFAAVLAVTDEPAVLSRSGGVRFSRADTHALVAQAAATSPALAEELTRRDGHVPVLRLPFPAEGVPPDGYDTVVVLPLRDDAAREAVEHRLAEVDDALLLALPDLSEVVVDLPGRPPRRLADVMDRWHVRHTRGVHAVALLADRPTEEQTRTAWQVTWALPHDAGTRPSAVLHAPTPTDEPLPWPALLIASFPLDPSRRHVAPGPAAQALVAESAAAFAALLSERARAGDDVLDLVPTGFAVGWLDGELREAVLAALVASPILHAAENPAVILRPRDALMLEGPAGGDDRAVRALASSVAGLVHAPREALPALAALDVPRVSLADLVDSLPAVPDPDHWRGVYEALSHLARDPLAREALAGLPVPLADGRVVRGARGAVLPIDGAGTSGDQTWPAVASALAALGVRAVHAGAAHPLLERLGAVPADAAGLLARDEVRAAAEEVFAHPEPATVEAMLVLVAAAVSAGELGPGALPWLGDLPLPDAEGESVPASALAIPGSTAAGVFDTEVIGQVSAELLERWGAPVLSAVGVLEGLALLHAEDVELDADPDEDAEPAAGEPALLDGWAAWVRQCLADVEAAGLPSMGARVAEVVAVCDLDAVRGDAWPAVLHAIATGPALRAALTRPARVLCDGGVVDVGPYTSWWLRGELTGSAGAVAAGGADPLVRLLLPPAPVALDNLDPAVQAALGVVSRLPELPAQAVPAVLDRLADPELALSAEQLVAVWGRVARLAEQGADADPPASLRVVDGAGTRVVPRHEVVVADAPFYLQRPDRPAQIAAAGGLAMDLADLLDVPLCSAAVAGVVEEHGAPAGRPSNVPAGVTSLLPGAPAQWCEHECLLVDGVEVDWWVEGGGPDARVHAATVEGLACGLAWAAGRWGRRHVLLVAVTEPGRVPGLLVEDEFGGGQPPLPGPPS